jgi:hypothetical protein
MAFKAANMQNATSENIKDGVTIASVIGSYQGTVPVACSSDGQEQCTTNISFPAIDLSKISPWDIRFGKTVGGVGGAISKCRNTANLAVFDVSDSDPTTPFVIGRDPYDSVDEANFSGSQLPSDAIFGEQYACGLAHWALLNAQGGIGGNLSNCNSTNSQCVAVDLQAKMAWTRLTPGVQTRTWSDAAIYCSNLTYKGLSGWRLPTQKELLQAYINGSTGVTKQYLAGFGRADRPIWSATTRAASTEQDKAWYVDWSSGFTYNLSKSTSLGFRCVRDFPN